jgi:hypothetical protein
LASTASHGVFKVESLFFFTDEFRDPNDPRKEEDGYTGRVRREE